MVKSAAEKIDTSRDKFLSLVWPCMAPKIGGGALEVAAKPSAVANMDSYTYVDFYQVRPQDMARRGIAVQVQPGGKKHNSFTVRKTEYQKIRRVIDGGGQRPYWVVQAYLSRDSRRLLSAAAIEIDLLYDFIRQFDGDNRYVDVRVNREDGKEFYVVLWWRLVEKGLSPRIVTEAEASKPQLSLFGGK